MSSPVFDVLPLGFPWVTADPFLFCVHHDDAYPAGDERMGPPASMLAGRNLGQDFEIKDGFRMYHGDVVPGFPQHPHRGFETVTIVRRGFIDHSDSLGAAARFGRGDVQWLTAGAGICHSEMFPLLEADAPNPVELFQIWLNLPAADKMAPPHFSMLWSHDIPTVRQTDERGRESAITVVAGTFGGEKAPPPPPRSWASRPDTDVVADIRQAVAQAKLPEGYFVTLGGQFQAQEEASRLVGLLSTASALLMFVVLYSRYKSTTLSLMVMANIPLALVGAVFGLWLSGQPLSVAALIGFITLAGISVRNGILKVSHYLNLMRLEGEHFDRAMIVRGSLERLSPVLMTALVTAFALAPLLFEAERPGTEILHPVAVVIFSGLISSTLLDTFLTPAMFWLFGRKPSERLLGDRNADAY